MRRLILTAVVTCLAFLLLVPPAWAAWTWPVRGEVITPYRNGDDPYASGQHRGIDIAGHPGTPVVAAAGGEVRFAGTAGSSGLTVSVRTSDARYDTSYLHLSSAAVREGDRVSAGERLGTVGTTGVRSASAAHLHFGIRDAGSRHAYHDPLDFLPPAPPPSAAPRGAPAPQPAPAPIAPRPAPAPVQAPAGRRVPAPAPRRIPAPAPRRIPAPAPRRVPGSAPRRVPTTAPRRITRPAPHGAPRTAPHGVPRTAPHGVPGSAPHGVPGTAPHGVPRTAPHGVPGTAPGRAPNGIPSTVPRHVPDVRRTPALASGKQPTQSPTVSGAPQPAAGGGPSGAAGPDSSGPDLGLLLACLGVLAAAGLLGLTSDGQDASRSAGHRIARVLHPLLGRR